MKKHRAPAGSAQTSRFMLIAIMALICLLSNKSVRASTELSRMSAQSCSLEGLETGDFYAYYTKIGSGEKWEQFSRTGPYADIVVQLSGGKFVFARSLSYSPYWETKKGKWYVDDIMRRNGNGTEKMPDRTNTFSHVKVVKQNNEKIVVHWRHLLEFADGNPHVGVKLENFVDEYFTIQSEGKIERTFRKATEKIDNWLIGSNLIRQTFELKPDGIKNVQTKRGKGEARQERIKGNPVKKAVVSKPAVSWKFDEGIGDLTKESVTGLESEIAGHKSLWKKGISGTCLQFDGYASQVILPAAKAPAISDEITLEAWVALGANPWNWASIVQQGDDVGYSLGVNSRGNPGIRLNIGQERYEVVADKVLKVFRWYHLAGTYNKKSKEIRLYIDGKEAATKSTNGDNIWVANEDVKLGKGKDGEATDIVRPLSDIPFEYGFDGLIDEVRIYGKALTADEVAKSCSVFEPGDKIRDNADMQVRKMPEVKSKGKFGAHHAKLFFYETWENLFRDPEVSDLVVTFDDPETKFVFWRGAGYIPMMVTEKNYWFTNEFNEIWATEALACMEPMSDYEHRHNEARIIENTDARVVVHWRYSLIDFAYVIGNIQENGWGDWSDWYYTIYPDGVAVVKMQLWTDLAKYRGSWKGHREWMESIFIIPPGKKPEDIISQKPHVSVANLEGEHETYDWPGPEFDVDDIRIRMHYMKEGKYQPYMIADFSEIGTWPTGLTGYSTFQCFNHWPAARMKNDGRDMMDDTRIGHACVGSGDFEVFESDLESDAPYVTKLKIEGLTKGSVDELVPLARSWLRPANIQVESGCESEGYDKAQRAYVLAAKDDKIVVKLEGSKKSPIYNPCFVIKNWGCDDRAGLKINGTIVKPGKNFRQGIVRDTDGREVMVIWVKLDSTSPVKFSICEGKVKE